MSDVSNNYMIIGKILSAHGIKGYVKVYPLTDNTERYNGLKNVYAQDGINEISLTIEDVFINNQFVLIKFQQINDRTNAEKLKNNLIYIGRDNAVSLEEDEYFIQDLIGLTCYDINNNNIGTISEIIQTGSVDVLVIKGQSEYLIPALKKNVWPMPDKGMVKVDTSSGVESD